MGVAYLQYYLPAFEAPLCLILSRVRLPALLRQQMNRDG